MGSRHALPCLVVLLLAAWGHCSISVINEIIPTEGDEFLMKCKGDGDLSYFMLHTEGKMLQPAYYERLRITVFQNASVFFESISLEHVGTHLCIRKNGGEDHGYRTHLEVRPLPPDNLWVNVYRTKFITGFIAAMIIALLFILGCLVHKYRWEASDQDTSPIVTNSAYINPALVNDDTESGCSTKM
ncbi:uncharacterized protein LOC123513703 [Portunus trituberculatus]|uniref:uncharacterized protein LOC123513703 n=1 Tax=Portunus trituberculatus TaxID=210409 RepID=UPI001E1CE9BB|nr:uncharacterized protein LOC123513703 [Portunus trituberculatus]